MRFLVPNYDLFSEMDRFIEGASRERMFSPSFESSETDQHYLLSVDLPGMKKEDIKIEFQDGVLSISGQHRRGEFRRVFRLPKDVEVEKIEANHEDGVLELFLPKAEAAKPRLIEIQSGKKPAH